MSSNQILKILLESSAHQCKPPAGLHRQLTNRFIGQVSTVFCEEIGDRDSKDIL